MGETLEFDQILRPFFSYGVTCREYRSMNKASEPIGLFFSTFRLKLRSIAFILILIIDESMQILFFRIGQASVDLRAIIIYGIMPFGKIAFVHFDQFLPIL